MRPETERMMKAFLEVYEDFTDIYKDFYYLKDGRLENELFIEISNLFHTAWNDSMLGELLKKEVLERYQQLLEEEQVKREIEEEAESGEAMMI